jgi:hypothetical protein
MRNTDFHLELGEKLNEKHERNVLLEAKLVFPEIDEPDLASNAIPEGFNQMIIDEPQGAPYCRVRLEATWIDDGTPEGDIQQKLSWILTASNDPEVVEASKSIVRPAQRSKIRVVYVPATRDPSSQIRTTTTSTFGRLLHALDWKGKDEQIKERLAELKNDLGMLQGIGTMNTTVQQIWRKLYDGRVAANMTFESLDADPANLLDMIAPMFAPNEIGQSIRYTELSDGLRSLFALSLPLGLFRIEELLKADAVGSGFSATIVDTVPLLTLFAVEEPENHLSPHYLGKIIIQMYEIAKSPTAQVVLSSHSPSIMARVVPDDVRYLLGGEAHTSTQVRTLALPTDDSDEAYKYVREAVRGYPELYFARLVILGEGPSEEIVLNKLFEASGSPLDTQFIAVVPLGGRHVNHFWRLLNGLGIPYITLLDLDREKEGAGWGRLQYVLDQLVDLYGPDSNYIKYRDSSGEECSLSDQACSTLAKNDAKDTDALQSWQDWFRSKYDIFFSSPLDLDLSMLECFPSVYKSQAPEGGGPRLPNAEPQLSTAVRNRMRQVLAPNSLKTSLDIGSTYSQVQRDLFPWYKYLFIDGSKPVAHMRALVALDASPWPESVPETLKLLLARAQEIVSSKPSATLNANII